MPPEAHLTLNGRNIPFGNRAKYLGVIFEKRITWRLYIEMVEAKAFRKLIHKALIRSVMTYACPAWELAADTFLLKLQRQQNKVLRTIGNLPRCTPGRI
jgi:hypothetical protein